MRQIFHNEKVQNVNCDMSTTSISLLEMDYGCQNLSGKKIPAYNIYMLHIS